MLNVKWLLIPMLMLVSLFIAAQNYVPKADSVMRVYKSSAGGTFGLYTSGQTGTTITLGTDILL